MTERRFLILLVGLLAAPGAQAYSTYNRLGYVSCNACHFVPTGGGMLTPYGESVQAAMSAFSQDTSPNERRLYGGVQARALEINSTNQANPFLMQADVMGTAFVTKSMHLDAALGANLKQGASDFVTVPSGWDGLVLRRAILTADVSDSGSVEVGRDAAVGGLNIDDHTSFLRMRNRRGVYDYPTQLRYIYQSEKVQLIPYLSAPSFEEIPGAQEYGGGGRGEYLLNLSNSVGLTGLFGNSTDISRAAVGGFFRLSHDHWNGIQGEAVATLLNQHQMGTSFGQQDIYIRPYIAIPEWIETSFVYEYLHVSDPFYESGMQYGPEINIRLHKYISVIGDGRNLVEAGNSDWSWYGQIFLHVQI